MTAAAATPPAAVGAAWRPTPVGWAARAAVAATLVGTLAAVIATVPQFWAFNIALAAIYAIIGLSLNIVMGYVGQVSLGHHAFVGIAAFVSANLVGNHGQSFVVGLVAAALSGAVAAGLLGLVALRIRGLYLALITLTYGFAAVNSLFEIPALTGGGLGLTAPRPAGFTTDRAYAFLCLGVLALVILVDWRLMASKVGRAIFAIRHSESVASSYAVNVTAYKVLAFTLSGTFAGIAGGLFAHRTTSVVAADFNFGVALLWVLMVVVGGLGRRSGVVVSSAFFALFPFLVPLVEPLGHFLEDTLQRDPEEFTIVIGAVLALFTIVKYPGGVADQLRPLTSWLAGQRFSLRPHTTQPSSAVEPERAGAPALAAGDAPAGAQGDDTPPAWSGLRAGEERT